MSKCPRCGKMLSTQQALEYHLNKNVCKKTKTQENEVKELQNTNNYDITFFCDLKGIITHISNEDSDYLGYKPHEMIGRSGYDFMYIKDKFHVSQLHIETLITKQPQIINFRRISKTNDIIPVQSSGIINENMNEIQVFEKILNFHKNDSINFILNNDGTYSWISHKFTEMYGYTLEDIVDTHDMFLIVNHNQAWFLQTLIDIREQKQINNIKLCRKHKNGCVIPVEGNALFVGNFIMMSETLRNIVSPKLLKKLYSVP